MRIAPALVVLVVCLSFGADAMTHYAKVRMNLTCDDGLDMLLSFRPDKCESIDIGSGFFGEFEDPPVSTLSTKSIVRGSSLEVSLIVGCTFVVASDTVDQGACGSLMIPIADTPLKVTNVATYTALPPPTPTPALVSLGAKVDSPDVSLAHFSLDIGFDTGCDNNMQLPYYMQGLCIPVKDFARMGGGRVPLALQANDLPIFMSLQCHEYGVVLRMSSKPDCSESTQLAGVAADLPHAYPVMQGMCQMVWFNTATSSNPESEQQIHLPIFVHAGQCTARSTSPPQLETQAPAAQSTATTAPSKPLSPAPQGAVVTPAPATLAPSVHGTTAAPATQAPGVTTTSPAGTTAPSTNLESSAHGAESAAPGNETMQPAEEEEGGSSVAWIVTGAVAVLLTTAAAVVCACRRNKAGHTELTDNLSEEMV